MANIEKLHVIDKNKLSGEFYFTTILQEAYACGLISDTEAENVQMQCIQFLAYKSERYNSGDSSSIRVEAAESIMKSNLYTIGLYLKSLPDADRAVEEIKGAAVSEMYDKGRKIINTKFLTAKHINNLVQRNKLNTPNYTYNATVNDGGIESFFKLYNPDYEAHETIADIDYQLCNPVVDLAGVEYIQKYLENIYLENEFCRNYEAEAIHHLLYGYDEGYKDLLINIFEHVLTAAVGRSLLQRSVTELDISGEEVQRLYYELSKDDDNMFASKIRRAKAQIFSEMNIASPSLQKYIEISLPKITWNIRQAVKTNTLDKTFVVPVNPDLKPKIKFLWGVKMEDEDYRKFIEELSGCRFWTDKLALIKDRVKSFGDLEDVLFDAQLSQEEIISVFSILEDVEIAALVKSHPFNQDVEAIDLSEAERAFRQYLNDYMNQLTAERQVRIQEIVSRIAED